MRFITPYKRAHDLGSARRGTAEHVALSTSGWALAVLVPIFVCILARTLGGGIDEVRATFGNPFVAILTALFLVVGLMHFARGARTPIEDYTRGFLTEALILIAGGIAWVLMAAGLYALARLAF